MLRNEKTTARTVGVLYIIGTVAGILTLGPLSPLDAPELLPAVADGADRVMLGASLILIMGFALALIPLTAYPIIREHSEPLALGYAVFRSGLETAGYLVAALIPLVLVSVGQDHLAAGGPAVTQLEAIGTVLLEVNETMGHGLQTIVFVLGALMFYYALFQARLVPQWLSGWGLVAALPYGAAGVLAIFGLDEPRSTAQIALQAPLGIQEMVLAGWLIVKGFDASAIDPVGAGFGPQS